MSNSAAAPRLRASVAALAVGVMALLGCASVASANTFNATDGPSLVSAFTSANTNPGEDTIRLIGAGPWLLPSPVTITGDVVVSGRLNSNYPAQQNSINGTFVSPPQSDTFTINPNVHATFKSVVVASASDSGFAVFRNFGTLDLLEVELSGNAGIPLVQEVSTAVANLYNTTVDSNFALAFQVQGTLRLNNSTVADNTQGGIEASGATTFVLNNTILRNNVVNCIGLPTSTTGSMSDDESCQVQFNSTDANLGPTQANGGPSQTQAPAAGSPAIDAGNNAVCTTVDQRGFLRNVGQCDIGAHEVGGSTRDTTPPSCGVTGVSAGPPRTQTTTTQDLQSGLFRFFEPFVTNGSVALGAFPYYTRAGVSSTATKTNQSLSTRWGYQVEDISNNVQNCQ